MHLCVHLCVYKAIQKILRLFLLHTNGTPNSKVHITVASKKYGKLSIPSYIAGFTPWLPPPQSECQRQTLMRHSEVSEAEHFGANTLNCDAMGGGFSNITCPLRVHWKCTSFSTQDSTITAPQHPTRQMVLYATFLFSLKWGWSWKVTILALCKSTLVHYTLVEWDFQGAFQAWQEPWERYITAQVDYFEGDGGQI